MRQKIKKIKKLAIIGASYLQVPLILKAQEMGLETHVFAWEVGDEGERLADYFYPISIIEKEAILEKCREIGIHGICSIASDLAVNTVNYVAQNLGLIGNSEECTKVSTNKYDMRLELGKSGLPIPQVYFSGNASAFKEKDKKKLTYPLICKPTDRSGSRGVFLVNNSDEFETAVGCAMNESMEKRVILEEYVEGNEYSVECISWKGSHTMLAITEKLTTGAPNFIEKGHIEPAELSDEKEKKVETLIYKALDALKVENGASHSEIKIDADGNIKIIEIGSRMGGDLIGSHLVPLSTGIDFIQQVVRVALGLRPNIKSSKRKKYAAIYYVLNEDDLKIVKEIKNLYLDFVVEESFTVIENKKVTDSSMRNGYIILASEDKQSIMLAR